jgi:hypothetical protein
MFIGDGMPKVCFCFSAARRQGLGRAVISDAAPPKNKKNEVELRPCYKHAIAPRFTSCTAPSAVTNALLFSNFFTSPVTFSPGCFIPLLNEDVWTNGAGFGA